jgi:hypothetical protein
LTAIAVSERWRRVRSDQQFNLQYRHSPTNRRHQDRLSWPVSRRGARWRHRHRFFGHWRIIAAIMVVFVIADVFIGWTQGAPIVRVFALIAAVLVWLIGCACRALLSAA